MKTIFSFRVLAGGAAALSGGFGLFTLAAWVLGNWKLATLGADYIPMAPMTAFLFALLGLAMGGRLWREESRSMECAVQACAALSAVVSVLELARWIYEFPLPWDSMGFGVEASFGVMEIGRMAPLTAATFFLATIALAAQGKRLRRYLTTRWVASGTATVGFLIGIVVVVAYVTGTPLGYKPESVPMALLTALAFVTLNAGFLFASQGGEWVRMWRSGRRDSAVSETEPQPFDSRLGLIFAMIVFICVLSGFFYLRREQTIIRRGVHDEMLAIAELKAGQLEAWRNERLGDARVVASFPNLAGVIAGMAENPASETSARVELVAYLNSVLQTYAYQSVVVFDRTMTVLEILPSDSEWDRVVTPELRLQIREARDVIEQGFHRDTNGVVHMGLLMPVRTRDGRDFAGAVLLTLNARMQIFPLLHKWPTPSASAETELVRREGEYGVFISELRHVKNTPMEYRVSLTDPTSLMARVLRDGACGLLEGTDYRGVPVLGVARPVAGSPWIMIAKMDQSEAYAPVRKKALQVFFAVVLMTAVGALFVKMWWQQRQRDLIQRQLTAERTARAANERLALVMRHANDVILLFDDQGRIVEFNDRVRDIYGYAPEDLRHMTVYDLHDPRTHAEVSDRFATVLATKGLVFETEHRRADGMIFPVEISTQPVELEGRPHLLSFVRNITERNRMIMELRASEERYRTILNTSPDGISISNLEDSRQSMVSPGLVKMFGYTCAEELLGRSIFDFIVPDDLKRAAANVARIVQADSPGPVEYRGIRRDGGVFDFEANGTIIEDAEGRPLQLVVIVRDITERKRAEIEAKEGRDRHRLLFNAMLDGLALHEIICDQDGNPCDYRFLEVNPAFEQLTGLKSTDVLGRTVLQVMPDTEPFWIKTYGQVALTGESVRVENYSVALGKHFDVMAFSPSRNQFVTVFSDITERKKSEQALRESEYFLNETQTNAGLGSYILDVSTGLVSRGSEMMDKVFGIDQHYEHSMAGWVALIHPEDRAVIMDYYENEVLGRGHSFDKEYRIIRPSDQAERWVRGTGRLEFDDQGRVRQMRGTVQDITGAKRAEAELRKLSRIVEQAPLSIVITDLTGAIEYANPNFCSMTGYTLAEVCGQNPRVLKSGLTRPEVYHDMWETLTRHEVWRGELNNRKKSGEFYDELAVIAPVVDESGRVSHYVALKQDITERKKWEAVLRESEQRFRELFDLASDAILVTEAKSGRVVQANEAACSVYGYSVDELLAMSVLNISAEADKTRELLNIAEVELDTLIKVPNRLHRRHDGTVFPVEISVRSFWRDGRVLLVLLIRDITDQVKAREQLVRFNAELEKKVALRTEEIAARNREIEGLLQSIPDLVMRLRSDGTVLDFQAARGGTPLANVDEDSSQSGADHAFEPLVRAAIPHGNRALEENNMIVAEVDVVLGGAPLSTELRVAPIGKDEFVVFARDITERKRLDAAMVTMLEKERQVSELKSRFISMTSHEFRTPMAAVMVASDLLHHHFDRLDHSKREDLFTRIETALRRMTQMLDDILLLNRIDADRVRVRPEPVDLRSLATTIVDEIRLGDRDAHRFEFYVTGDLGHFVTDPELLRPILSNLLSNAVRYSPTGTVIITQIIADFGGVVITVEDQGIGIPEADRGRIFESFERGSNVGTIKGTGLGLNIVKRMTGLLGGSVVLETPIGGGSRFVLTFPRTETPPSVAS
ncbi:MAG: PAS domain S-box protein [Opitutaceae bacterium]|jgi:PAS domain S-box-containing protein